jgi:hypothetical protein
MVISRASSLLKVFRLTNDRFLNGEQDPELAGMALLPVPVDGDDARGNEDCEGWEEMDDGTEEGTEVFNDPEPEPDPAPVMKVAIAGPGNV